MTLADLIKEVQDKKKESLKQTGTVLDAFVSIKTGDGLNLNKQQQSTFDAQSNTVDQDELNSSLDGANSSNLHKKIETLQKQILVC